MKLPVYIFLFFLGIFSLNAQSVEFLGLSNKSVTSLKIGDGKIAAGTDDSGVYWKTIFGAEDTLWSHIDVGEASVRAVYPHKSGSLGWSIGIGTLRDERNNEFVYCSYLGGTPEPMSFGIDTNLTSAITGLDGYADPTICGETFAIGGRILYRRNFEDTTWQPVNQLSIEGNFETLKARQEFGYIYAGGSEGFSGFLLIRSSDAGKTWEDISPAIHVRAVDFWVSESHMVFATDGFQILRSLDSGDTWTEIFEVDSLSIKDLGFGVEGIFYFCADTYSVDPPRSYLYYTTDLGVEWNKIDLPVSDRIVDMDIDSGNNVYIAFLNSGVIKVESPVSEVNPGIRNNIPAEFVLFQNYPNPFNPATTIRYNIPGEKIYGSSVGHLSRSVFTTLLVYDILGRKVVTLVNEFKQPGTYQVDFRPKGLSSGIYFYQLRAGDLFRVRKMELIR